jgi:hypothetical protein
VVGSICGFENPEDVEVIPALGVLVVSQMRHAVGGSGGSLVSVPLDDPTARPEPLWPTPAGRSEPRSAYDADCREPPGDDFAPHGITAGRPDAEGRVRLAAVSHAPREAIELFSLERASGRLSARWLGCVALPGEAVGNDVVFGAGDALLVTKYRPTRDELGAALYSVVAGLGGDTGEVLHWSPDAGWQVVPGTEGANPNGILRAKNGTLYFSQTGTGRVARVAQGASAPDRRDARIGGHPDNLAWGISREILAVTHTQGPAFLLCVLGQSPCKTAWELWAIDPHSLEPTRLLHHDGATVGGVASAAVHDGRYFFGAVFGDRIGVWTPAAR